MVRARVQVRGRVQGVNFRSSTKFEADALGLYGWVCNLPDGSVEVVIEGERKKVEVLVDWCRRGPSWALVENFEVDWLDANGEFSDFVVRR